MKRKSEAESLKSIAWRRFRRNKLAMFGMLVIVILIISSLLAPFISHYDPNEIDLYKIESSPEGIHWLGTDELGRDMFSRLLYGGRVSLAVGIFASLAEIAIGVSLGSVAGFYGGAVDSVIMRITDIIMCFPFFVVAIALAAMVGPSMTNLIFIIAILEWTKIARIVRAEILSLKNRDYIKAARSLGLGNIRIIIKHVLPNTFASIMVFSTLAIANGILTEAALSFLGLGVRPPQPSWGNMLAAAQSMRVLQYEWWMWIPPGMMVFITVISINFLGDGLRDALDPKLKV